MKKIGLLAAGLAAWYLYNRNQTRSVRIRTPEISLPNAVSPFRITQITDFHNHRHLDPKRIASEVAAFSPRFIALTGDLISQDTKDVRPALRFAQALVQTDIPVLFVAGNHECHNPRRESFFRALDTIGVIRLNGRTLEFPEAVVSGIDYPAQLHPMPETVETDLPRILLAHSPTDIRPVDIDADLILCGHTHGGQVRLPGIGAILVPSEGLFAPVNKGLYRHGDALLYIDSGIGNTRLDLRAFNPIQFTNMKVTTHR